MSHRSLLVAIALAVGACSSNQGATVEVGLGSTSQALAPAAPAPSGDARHLLLDVREIRVNVGGSDGASEDHGPNGIASVENGKSDEDSGGGWVTVFSGDRTVDLTAGSTVADVLGSATVPAGTITQIRLVLGASAQLVESGQRTLLACGSCATSGLKIVPHGELTLAPGEHRTLTLGLDVDSSIQEQGGPPRLRPVIRLE